MIVSHFAFVWLVSLLTSGVGATWIVVDVVRLRRALRDRPSDVSDRVFGSIIGIVMGAVAVLGVFKYHLGG